MMVFGGGQIDHHQKELWQSTFQNDTLIAKQKKRIDIHQSASNIVMLFFVRFPAVSVRALLPAELSSVRPAA